MAFQLPQITMNPALMQGLLLAFMILIIMYLFYVIKFGVGFNNLRAIHKTFKGRRKGWGFVYMYNDIGNRERIPYQFKGEAFISPLGEGNGKYRFDRKLLQEDEYGFKYIEYIRGNYEPIGPRTSLTTLTSAELLEESFSIAQRAKNTMSGFWEKFKIYFYIGAALIALIVGGQLYIIHGQTQAMVDMSIELTRPVIANLSGIQQ